MIAPDLSLFAIVRHLIVGHHAPIGTSMRKPYGWYLIETREEHEAVVNLHRSRALAELETMAAHSHQALRSLVEQVQADLL